MGPPENDPHREEFRQIGQLLVERGLAKSFVHYDDDRLSQIMLSKDGMKLRKLLQKLFDVPSNDPQALTPDEIAGAIMFILLSTKV